MQARGPRLHFLARPPSNALVFFCLLGISLGWALLCALSHAAPDLDSMEELVWSASLELGYTKHPPLPTWFMYFASQLLGRPVWLPFLLGQLSSALGLWFVWRLGCELTSPWRAFMATLLVSVSMYFALRATIYNHDTAQLWTISASIWLFYRALRNQKSSSWLWLGLFAGLALLTKYSALIQFFAFFVYILRTGLWRQDKIWQGIIQAAVVFLLVISPHLLWLVQHQFAPFLYADDSLHAINRWAAFKSLLLFSLDQVARLAPMLVLLLVWLLWYKSKGNQGPGQAANQDDFNASAKPEPRYWTLLAPSDRQFLLWVGLTPFLSTLLVALLSGSKLEASWASTFFILFGFYAMGYMRGAQTEQLRRILILALCLHALMAVSYALARGPLADFKGYAARSNYPAAQLAQLALQHWQEHQSGRPLRVVAANTWLGGNIAIHTGAQTRVYIDAEDAQSPWFTPGRALDCGALVAYSPNGKGSASAALMDLYRQAPFKGVDKLRWPANDKGKSIDFYWAVVPAGKNCLSSAK